mgnify:CR=1 FL=1
MASLDPADRPFAEKIRDLLAAKKPANEVKLQQRLTMFRAMKKNNTPGGMALGHASGDGNGWTYWCLWAHGGNAVDKDNKVIINSPETVKALEYAKALSDTFIPGVASWNDSSNNKALSAGFSGTPFKRRRFHF